MLKKDNNGSNLCSRSNLTFIFRAQRESGRKVKDEGSWVLAVAANIKGESIVKTEEENADNLLIDVEAAAKGKKEREEDGRYEEHRTHWRHAKRRWC